MFFFKIKQSFILSQLRVKVNWKQTVLFFKVNDTHKHSTLEAGIVTAIQADNSRHECNSNAQ